MPLILPPKVREEIEKRERVEARRKYRAELFQMLDFNDPVCEEWNKVLKDVDPRLKLGRGRPTIKHGFPVKPLYYHMVMESETAPVSCNVITGPDGVSFEEPDSGLLEKLKQNDLQNPHVYAALIAQEAEREAEEERAEREHMEIMNQEVLEHYKAATRAQVSMNRDARWSQNVKGRRGRK